MGFPGGDGGIPGMPPGMGGDGIMNKLEGLGQKMQAEYGHFPLHSKKFNEIYQEWNKCFKGEGKPFTKQQFNEMLQGMVKWLSNQMKQMAQQQKKASQNLKKAEQGE